MAPLCLTLAFGGPFLGACVRVGCSRAAAAAEASLADLRSLFLFSSGGLTAGGIY
jgi:hypothetical protein